MGMYVHYFHLQSQQWEKKGTRMDTKEDFSSLLRYGYHMLSFDLRGGYRHLSLHRYIRNFFLFRCDGRLFRWHALLFGCGSSSFWFVNLLNPLVKYMW